MNTLALLLLLASQSGLRSTTLCTGTNPADCLPPPPICGNGIVHRIEACDDGNRTANDGCSMMCSLEPGYACTGNPSSCGPDCGDSLIVGLETCDDGNETAADGCSDSCAVESGWYCTGLPSVCVTTCGDGTKAGAEECDDGNLIDGDGCSATCTNEAAPFTTLIHLSFDESAVPYTNTGSMGGTFTNGGSSAVQAGVAGKFGKAVGQGMNSFIAGASPFPTYPSSGHISFTVGGWIKPTGIQPAWSKTLGQGNPLLASHQIGLTFDSSGTNHAFAELNFGSANCVASPPADKVLVQDVWSHVQYSYDDVTRIFTMHLNGELVASSDCSAIGNVNFLAYDQDRFQTGFDYYSQTLFGLVDEVYVTQGVYTPSCGDGVITYGEACDDGNTANGDGCSATCTAEGEPIGYWSGFSASNYFVTPETTDLFDATEADNTWMRCVSFAITSSTVESAQNIAGDGGWGGGDGTVLNRYNSSSIYATFRNVGSQTFAIPTLNNISTVCYGETGLSIVSDASWDAFALTSSGGMNTDAPNYTFKVGGPNDFYEPFSSGVIYAIAMYSTSATSGAIAAGIADGADGRFDNTTNATVICNGQQFQTGCEIGGAVFSKTGSPTFTAL